MARRRFRSNQRHEPTTERSFQEYILSTPAPQTSRTELLRLIRGGEDTYLELKVKLSNSERIAQGIVALANTGGGVIVFGDPIGSGALEGMARGLAFAAVIAAAVLMPSPTSGDPGRA